MTLVMDFGHELKTSGSTANRVGTVAPGKHRVRALGKWMCFIMESPTIRREGGMSGGMADGLFLGSLLMDATVDSTPGPQPAGAHNGGTGCLVLLSSVRGGVATTVDQSFFAPGPRAGAGGTTLIVDRRGEGAPPERLPTAVRRSWRLVEAEPGSRGEFLVGAIGEKGRVGFPRPRPFRLHDGTGVELAGGEDMD